MKIIILGAGTFGQSLVKFFGTSENDVVVVDLNKNILSELNDIYDIKIVCGSCSVPSTLEEAGVFSADVIIFSTHSDEINIASATILDFMLQSNNQDRKRGTLKKIARLRNNEYFSYSGFNIFNKPNHLIDLVVTPEIEIAKNILKILNIPGAFFAVDSFLGKIKIVGLKIKNDSEILNTPLKFFTRIFNNLDFILIAIKREEKIIIPSANDVILNDDEIYFATSAFSIEEAIKVLNLKNNSSFREILIVGGGDISIYLINELMNSFHELKIKLITDDLNTSKLISRNFRSVSLFNESHEIFNLFSQFEMSQIGTVISVSSDVTKNLFSAILAKKMGASRSIALAESFSLLNFVETLGIDAIIDLNAIKISSVVNKIKNENIHKIDAIFSGEILLVEIYVTESHTAVGISLDDLFVLGEILIIAIENSDGIITFYPKEQIISINDKILFALKKNNLRKIEKIFSKIY